MESQSLVTLSFHLLMLVYVLLHGMFNKNALCISGSTVALLFWQQIKSSNTFDVRHMCRKHVCRRQDVQPLSVCTLFSPFVHQNFNRCFFLQKLIFVFFSLCIQHAWLLFCCLVKSQFLQCLTANFCHHITHLRHINLIVDFCSY